MLTRPEAYRIINDYIGVSGGYLGDFSYRTHQEFYPYYCDLDIDPLNLDGTTRERFIQILEEAEPQIQARILCGVLAKFPAISDVPVGSQAARTPALVEEIRQWITRLENTTIVSEISPSLTSDVVERAIRDAQTLLSENGATSGVDRIHTALHGYLKAVCDAAGLAYQANASLPALFSLLRREHPAFQVAVASQEVTQILRSLGAIIDTFSPVRNQASLAHPNRDLIDEPEAKLVINTAHTLLHYIDSKLSQHEQQER